MNAAHPKLIWAIARNTVAQAVRVRVAFVIMAVYLVLVPVLPFILKGDGTPGGDVAQWTDRIIFSRNQALGDADDVTIANVPRTGALAQGGSYNANWNAPLPAGLSGIYYVLLMQTSTTTFTNTPTRSRTSPESRPSTWPPRPTPTSPPPAFLHQTPQCPTTASR